MSGLTITFSCNGSGVEVPSLPDSTLAEVLRRGLGLTGTKIGCGTGDCGACTVLLDGLAVCSCIVPAATCDGSTVVTIEGVAESELGQIVIDEFEAAHAVQCGICSPGLVVAAVALIADTGEALGRVEIQDGLSGNLCRCTGYRPIVDGVEAASRRWATRGGHE